MTTRLLSLTTTSRDVAYRLSGALTELMDPAPDAVSVYEAGAAWQVDAYVEIAPELEAGYAEAIAVTAGVAADTATWGPVPEKNWVAISQAALPPVWAGRFCIHGSHDRHRIPRGPWTIEIEAGEAFGTAHHATTYGCLDAISRLPERHRLRHALDLGTGSGVLAIAVARRFPHAAIIASDLDANSILVARENCDKNRASRQVRAIAADGVPRDPQAHRFDLVIANILAGPLIAMAGQVAHAVRPGGLLILSGILNPQAASVLAAYHARGLNTERHDRIEGWSNLTLKKRDRR